MDNHLEIEYKLGFPLGGHRGDVVTAFRQRGIEKLNPTSVSRLKAGMISGERTGWRLDAAKILEENNAGFKNQLYKQIIQAGLEMRVLNSDPQRGHLFKSDHYIEDTARILGENTQVIRRCIRAMRTDMVLAQVNSPDMRLLKPFLDIVDGYIEANRQIPPSKRSPAVVAVDREWDHTTVESFYRNIYTAAGLGGRVIGAWTPYEMDILSLFYEHQETAGNRLTPFDLLVLDSYIKGVQAVKIVEQIRESTGIDIDDGILEQHRNALVYSRPNYRHK